MTLNMSILLQIIFVILVILVFSVVYFNLRFANYLRIKHISVWEKLNKPSWAPSTSKENQLLMKKFLDKEGYLDLKDPDLNSLVNLKKKVSFCCIMVLFLYAGMFLAFVFRK